MPTHTENMEDLLQNILSELEELNSKEGDLYYKEWHPMTFQFYVKGYQIRDPLFGTSKWGFQKLNNDDLQLDFDYEFDSLQAHTENRQYNASFRLVINGLSYPNKERIASEYAPNYDDWQEFIAHNYCYQRAFRFARIWLYQSNHGYGDYPFKMRVNKGWTLNFDIFQTSTNNYWHFLIINGWKLHTVNKNFIKKLEKAII